VPQVTIRVPHDIYKTWLDKRIADVMRREGPFGTRSSHQVDDENSPTPDSEIEWEENELTIGFYLLLDRLTGPTAALLRRERFEKWDPYV